MNIVKEIGVNVVAVLLGQVRTNQGRIALGRFDENETFTRSKFI